MGIIITNNPVGTGHALSVNENWNRGYVSCQELTPIAFSLDIQNNLDGVQ